MTKRIVLGLIIVMSFFFGLTYAYAEEENILEGEVEAKEIFAREENIEVESASVTLTSEVATTDANQNDVHANEPENENAQVLVENPNTVAETLNDNPQLASENPDTQLRADNESEETNSDILNRVTNYSGTKVWNDEDDYDGVRPQIVNGQVDSSVMRFVLMGKVGENGTPFETDFVAKWSVSDNPNVWNYTFENIPIYDEESGEVIYYYVVEQVIPTGYDDENNPPTSDVTDTTYTIDSIDGSELDKTTPCDEMDFDISTTPTDIFFVVLKKGNEFLIWTPRTLSDKDKQAVETEIEESGVMNEFKESRTHFASGFDTFNLSGGIVEFKILEATNKIRMTLDDPSTWSYWASAVLDSKYITYDEGTTAITNTHVPTTTSITMYKVWEGNPEQDGVEIPQTIHVQLLADDKEVGDIVEVSGPKWEYTWDRMPIKDENGKIITYSVVEIAEGLISLTQKNGFFYSVANGLTITNTYITKKIDITVTKVWEGNPEQDGVEIPQTIHVQLLANDKEVGDVVEVSGPKWEYTWENLEENDETGVKITYSVVETIEGLISLKEQEGYFYSEVEGLTITNTYIPLTRDITVHKEWDDKDDYQGIRPDSVTIILLANEEPIDSVEVSGPKWEYTWYGLAVNDEDGNPITYTIDEEKIEGYEPEIEGDMEEGFLVTNVVLATGGNDDPIPTNNPNTADNIYIYMVMVVISLIGLFTTAYAYSKNN